MSDSGTIKRLGLSLCMIVKNEEKNIGGAISCVRSIVNEIIVVDTGSVDNTIQIAKELGARVFEFGWNNDFASARNFSLSYAQYEWILVLDADERIAERDLSRIKECITHDRYDAIVLTQRNYCNFADTENWVANDREYQEGNDYAGYFDVPIIRLFRNLEAIRFEGVVHEVVDDSVKGLRKGYLNVPIHHFSQYEEEFERQKKSEFYLSLLEKQLEQNPNDSKVWFLIGRQYYSVGRFPEAIAYLRRVIDEGTRCEMAYDNCASAHIHCGQFEEARDILERLLQINPRYAEAYTTLGICLFELGQTTRAVDILKRAIEMKPLAMKPYFNLAAMYYRQKDYRNAHTYINHAERVSPHVARIYYLKFFICFELKAFTEATRAANNLNRLDETLYAKIADRHEVATQKKGTSEEVLIS